MPSDCYSRLKRYRKDILTKQFESSVNVHTLLTGRSGLFMRSAEGVAGGMFCRVG